MYNKVIIVHLNIHAPVMVSVTEIYDICDKYTYPLKLVKQRKPKSFGDKNKFSIA
jgi:hypothetical protein